MSVGDVITGGLLVVGLVTVVCSCVGIAVMDDPLDRLHLVTPAATIGAIAVSASVIVREGPSAAGLAAIVVLVVVAGTSPFTSHAMARSIMVRRGADHDGFDAAREAAAGGFPPTPPDSDPDGEGEGQ